MASLSPEHLPKSRIVTYRSYDGTLVSAVVTMPFNLKRDGSNPASCSPTAARPGRRPTASADATALASRGYVVIQPNPRGSTGYGLAFQKANFQDLGGGDLKDEIAAKQFLVDSGYVDAEAGRHHRRVVRRLHDADGDRPDARRFRRCGRPVRDHRLADDVEHEDALLQAYQKSLLGSPTKIPRSMTRVRR